MVEERGRLVSHKEELQEQDEKMIRAVALNSCMYSIKRLEVLHALGGMLVQCRLS